MRLKSDRPWWNKVDADATDIRGVSDPEIDRLDPEARQVLAGVWQERGLSELKVAGGFSAITSELIEHGTADVVLKLVSRAVRDEVRHAEIAVDLASRYRDSEVLWPRAEPFPVPRLDPAPPRLRAALLVVTMCCFNETVACAILEAQLEVATSPLARAALQSVLVDEIDHARAGWAHLATPYVTASMKDEIARWLPRILRARLAELVDHDTPFPGEDLPGHGVLSRATRKKIVANVIEDVMCPGFQQAGIDPSAALAWSRETFAG